MFIQVIAGRPVPGRHKAGEAIIIPQEDVPAVRGQAAASLAHPAIPPGQSRARLVQDSRIIKQAAARHSLQPASFSR